MCPTPPRRLVFCLCLPSRTFVTLTHTLADCVCPMSCVIYHNTTHPTHSSSPFLGEGYTTNGDVFCRNLISVGRRMDGWVDGCKTIPHPSKQKFCESFIARSGPFNDCCWKLCPTLCLFLSFKWVANIFWRKTGDSDDDTNSCMRLWGIRSGTRSVLHLSLRGGASSPLQHYNGTEQGQSS